VQVELYIIINILLRDVMKLIKDQNPQTKPEKYFVAADKV